MPYTIRKQKCRQSDGGRGRYVLSYTDKKGKRHRACHTSRKKARGQISAIEMEGIEETQHMTNELKQLIRQLVVEAMLEMNEAAAASKEEMKDHEAHGGKKKKKKGDVTGDGKADFTDVMASRMMASGMPKNSAVAKAKKAVD